MMQSQMVLQMTFSDDASCDISVNGNNGVDDYGNGYDSDNDANGNNEDKNGNNANHHNFDNDYGNSMIIIMLLSCHVCISERLHTL